MPIHDILHQPTSSVTQLPILLTLNILSGEKNNQYRIEVLGLVACFPISTEYISQEIINLQVSSELVSESAKSNIVLPNIDGWVSTSIGITCQWVWHGKQVTLKGNLQMPTSSLKSKSS